MASICFGCNVFSKWLYLYKYFYFSSIVIINFNNIYAHHMFSIFRLYSVFHILHLLKMFSALVAWDLHTLSNPIYIMPYLFKCLSDKNEATTSYQGTLQATNSIESLNSNNTSDLDSNGYENDLDNTIDIDEEDNMILNEDIRLNSLNILGLNVCGIASKLRNGAFELYAEDFDIICLTETKSNLPDLSNTCLSNFKCIPLLPKSRGQRYGGFHGICVLIREKYINSCKKLDNLSSPSTLWLSFSGNLISLPFILGITYIPGENSIYYDHDIFNTLSEDILLIKEQYDVPICIVGDLNSRTGTLDDFITIDDHVARSID